MKLFNRLLLINWHNIDYALIEFKKINFLTGENGAGKSTIIDAVQYVLQGNQKANYFNKAANEKAGRTVDSYIKCEISDDGSTGFKYKRTGNFSSYIALEFYDDKSNRYFVLGVVFDAFDNKETNHKFFSIDSKLPDNCFLKNDVAIDGYELKAFLENLYGSKNYRIYQSDKEYQEASLAKLGSVNRKFYELFKKAVSFSPIEKIDQFIVNFVCNIKDNVDIESMKENIKHYTNLENDVKLIEERIMLLEGINDAFSKYKESKEKQLLYKFLIDYSSLKSIEDEINKSKADIEKISAENTLFHDKYAIIEEDISKKEEQIRNLTKKIDFDDNGRIALQFEEDMKKLEKSIEHGEKSNEILIKKFSNRFGSYKAIIRAVDDNLIDMSVLDNYKSFENAVYSKERINSVSNIDIEEIKNLINDSKTLQKYSNKKCFEYENIIENYNENINKLILEIEGLEKGRHKYDDLLIEFKTKLENELQNRFKEDVKVDILADLIEIKDEKWRSAIEGYLNTQRDYLIIEPKYFEEASKIYRKISKENAKYHSIGIVDLQKVYEQNISISDNSLAMEIDTKNEFVKKYIDYILGNVIKCDDIHEMREHNTSITMDCILYKNFVIRKINPNIYKNPYIGKNSIGIQLDGKRKELELTRKSLYDANLSVKTYNALKNIDIISEEFVEDIVENIKLFNEKEQFKIDLIEIKKKYNSIDMTTIYSLQEDRKKCEQEKNCLEKSKEKLGGQISYNKKEIERLNDDIAQFSKDYDEQEIMIKEKFNNDFAQNDGIKKYESEKRNKTNKEIEQNFKPQLGKISKEYEDNKVLLFDARRKYIDTYRLSYNCYDEDNKEYENALNNLKENELPSYIEKIKDSKRKAEEQFKEDFLAKLKQNIEEAKRQISDLNKALKAHSFGTDSYEFKVEPNEEKRALYNMITDNMLNEGYNLATEAFNQKYSAEIEEMFDKLKYEDNLEEYTDYRNYLVFDLLVKKPDGTVLRLSKMLSKQSGGETQTPFYISVLASFSQLYHMNNNFAKRDNMINLVVFDEAFSKMDKTRIVESVKLLRRMGFQAIISAPPEKLTDIFNEVDETILVIKGEDSTRVGKYTSNNIQ